MTSEGEGLGLGSKMDEKAACVDTGGKAVDTEIGL